MVSLQTKKFIAGLNVRSYQKFWKKLKKHKHPRLNTFRHFLKMLLLGNPVLFSSAYYYNTIFCLNLRIKYKKFAASPCHKMMWKNMSWIFKTSVFWDVTQCSLVHLPNHTVTSQETPIFILNGLRTPNPTTWILFIL